MNVEYMPTMKAQRLNSLPLNTVGRGPSKQEKKMRGRKMVGGAQGEKNAAELFHHSYLATEKTKRKER